MDDAAPATPRPNRRQADARFAPPSMPRSSRKGISGPLRSTVGWRFLILAEIGNFPSLRRHVGRERADRLVIDVADRIGALVPAARLAVCGRAQLEIAFEDGERATIDRTLADLAQAFANDADLEHEVHLVEMAFGASAAVVAQCDEVRLIEEAEAALAAARLSHRPVVRDLSKLPPLIGRAHLAQELPRAIVSGQLFLQFQPKLHLRRQEIVGVEALVRWDHPSRGLVLPGDFIAQAEASRHIGPLTLWTIEQALVEQERLAARGHDLPVYVNVSGLLLCEEEFVAQACARIGDRGASIGLEITETAVIREPERAIENLNRLAGLGIKIAIDDYGAGLSSLAYLKQLPACELKIDKLFVTQLTSSNRDPLIVRSTIDLAHAMEMEVTAEGVESPAALALLTVMGCDMVQGYLISRPVGFDALVQYLDEDGHLAAAVADPRANFGGLAMAWKRA